MINKLIVFTAILDGSKVYRINLKFETQKVLVLNSLELRYYECRYVFNFTVFHYEENFGFNIVLV